MSGLAGGPGWEGRPPPLGSSLWVVAPHPDDEVLGAAGLMRWAAARGAEVDVVAVTDGEASHARSRAVSRCWLVERRVEERHRALSVLGVRPRSVHRLGLPDGGLASVVDVVEDRLSGLLDGHGDATVVVPAATDRHPDHRATWRAATAAARGRGLPVLEMPIWSRVDGVEEPDGRHLLRLGRRGTQLKRAAVACFASQLHPIGPGPADGPVLHLSEVAAMTSPTEWFVA